MTNLTEAQKDQVRAWLRSGLQLSELQNRLASDLGMRLTYMEVKLLVSELDLVPKDREPAAPLPDLGERSRDPSPPKPAPARAPAGTQPGPGMPSPTRKAPVTVTVDSLTRPGAMVSGGVTFSDGKRATWLVDEMGRLSVSPAEPGYRPPPTDMQEFQSALERELARAGF
jgi:hypothetical protein